MVELKEFKTKKEVIETLNKVSANAIWVKAVKPFKNDAGIEEHHKQLMCVVNNNTGVKIGGKVKTVANLVSFWYNDRDNDFKLHSVDGNGFAANIARKIKHSAEHGFYTLGVVVTDKTSDVLNKAVKLNHDGVNKSSAWFGSIFSIKPNEDFVNEWGDTLEGLKVSDNQADKDRYKSFVTSCNVLGFNADELLNPVNEVSMINEM